MARQIPWLRVFVEGVAIVVSILLAFGLQAWWEGRQERELEARLLEAVASEVAANEVVLRDHLQFTAAMLDRTDRFLRSDPADLAALPLDSVRPFLEALSRPETFDPRTAAASLAAETPVPSPSGIEVRGLISRFFTEIGDADEERGEFRDASLAVRGRMAQYSLAAASDGVGTTNDVLARLGPAVLRDLRADDELVRLVLMRSTVLVIYRNNLTTLGQVLDSLVRTLDTDAVHS